MEVTKRYEYIYIDGEIEKIYNKRNREREREREKGSGKEKGKEGEGKIIYASYTVSPLC